MRRGLVGSLLALTTLLLAELPTQAAHAAPQPSASPSQFAVPAAAPQPTSTAVSPQAPDPHPPLGGRAPDGSAPGGARLDSRGFILPAGAPKLPQDLTSMSWVLSDLDTGQVLAARDPHGRYQPASVLKLLTAITILPDLPGNRVVTVSPAAAAAEGSALGLLAGAQYTVDNLFQALLLVSANDAAMALAQADGGVVKTVAAMNATARRLGAYDTYVQTPSGLDGWQQLTSAYDLSLVLRAAVDMPRLLAYDELPRASYPPKHSATGSVGNYEFDNQSNDFLAGVPGAVLAKTGYTDAALHTFAAVVSRHGRRLGIIFLRNQRAPLDQWQQAAALFDWGYALPAGTPAVGTLVAPSSPDPAAASESVAAADPAPSATNSPQHEAAPLLDTAPASVTGHRQSAAGARDGLITAAVLLAAVAALRMRLRRRRRRRRQAQPRARAARPPADARRR